jgi:hypothetical protein
VAAESVSAQADNALVHQLSGLTLGSSHVTVMLVWHLGRLAAAPPEALYG